MQKSLDKGIQEYDALTTRKTEIVTNLVNSNLVDNSFVKKVTNLLNNKNKRQFSLEHAEGISNFFTINPTNPQIVQIGASRMTFQNGNS